MPGGRPRKRSTEQARAAWEKQQKARQQAGECKARAGSTASYSGAPSSRAAKAASGAPMVTRSKVPHGDAQGRPMGTLATARSQATRTAKAVGSRRQADELHNLAYKLGQEPSGRAEAIGLFRRARSCSRALWTR